jgi:diketogulonate reductase-like aldo/keto reductase
MTYHANTTVPLASGGAIPLIGFGTWQLSGAKAYESTKAALEIGYRHIDTATLYGNEAEVGRALKDSGVSRDDVFITTKLPPDRAGRERKTLTDSLRLLDVDAVDLWLIHWPPSGSPAIDTWRAFQALRDEGLTKAIGVSNYSVDEIDALIKATGEAPVVNQVSWSPTRHDLKILKDNRDRGIVLEGYSPLKHTNLRTRDLFEISQAHQVTAAQVVLRWHVQHEIVVIPRSSKPERVAENFDLFSFELTDDEMRRIDSLADV